MTLLGSGYVSNINQELHRILKQIPAIKISSSKTNAHNNKVSSPWDIILEIQVGGKSKTLIVQAKPRGEPRIIREVFSTFPTDKKSYYIFSAPYLSEHSRQICKDLGIGFIDLSGNYRLAFDNIFIEHEGFPNLKVEKRPLKTLFATKASRVLRLLLTDPSKRWYVQDLAKKANVSIGLVSKVKQRLVDFEYGIIDNDKFMLINPTELVQKWAELYSYKDNNIVECYALGDVHELVAFAAKYCTTNKIPYALTLLSGSVRVASFITSVSQGAMYVNTNPNILAQKLGWKQVTSGANIILIQPFDTFIFQGLHKVDGLFVVSDLQLYLDLMSFKGRGKDVAQFILEQRLAKQW